MSELYKTLAVIHCKTCQKRMTINNYEPPKGYGKPSLTGTCSFCGSADVELLKTIKPKEKSDG